MTRPLPTARRMPMKTAVGVTIIGQAIVFLGIIADITQLAGKGWLKEVVTSAGLRWASLGLCLILTGCLVLMMSRVRKQEGSLQIARAALSDDEKSLSNNEKSLSDRFIRTLRPISLGVTSLPPLRDGLEPMLNELARRLPEHGGRYKFAIVRPLATGRFEVLAERGMDVTSVKVIEEQANWKERKSFFSATLNDGGESPYRVFETGKGEYIDLHLALARGERPSSSVQHFIAPLRDPVTYKNFPNRTVALVSVGIPSGAELSTDDDCLALYSSIYCVLEHIEALLLVYLIALERNQALVLAKDRTID